MEESTFSVFCLFFQPLPWEWPSFSRHSSDSHSDLPSFMDVIISVVMAIAWTLVGQHQKHSTLEIRNLWEIIIILRFMSRFSYGTSIFPKLSYSSSIFALHCDDEWCVHWKLKMQQWKGHVNSSPTMILIVTIARLHNCSIHTSFQCIKLISGWHLTLPHVQIDFFLPRNFHTYTLYSWLNMPKKSLKLVRQIDCSRSHFFCTKYFDNIYQLNRIYRW